jgi:hypothetical protein
MSGISPQQKKNPRKKESGSKDSKAKDVKPHIKKLHVSKKEDDIYKLLGEILLEEGKKGDHIFL